MAVQTLNNELYYLGVGDQAGYAYSDTNWENYTTGKELFGLWGYVNVNTENLEALGFIEKDAACTDNFLVELGADRYGWDTPLPGTVVKPPANIELLEASSIEDI